MTTRHLFVINPAAGRKDRTKSITANVESLLLTDPYDIFVTTGVGSATEGVRDYLAAHPDDFVRIYACGGDGTLCEAANGIYEANDPNCAIGVVPIGSGNDFAKTFDIPADRFGNLRDLVTGEIRPIDYLEVTDRDGNKRISLNIVSAGFDAAVCKGQEKFKKLPLVSGSGAYNMSLVQCVFTKTKNYFRLFVDGVQISDGKSPYLFAIAANGRYYGGGFKAAPYSELSDGMLDFICIDTVPRLKFLTLVGKFREGRHIDEMKDVVTYTRGRELRISADKPIDVNIDGEIIPMLDPVVRIVPSGVQVILPSGAE